jgi:hypothetical protein
VEVYFQSCVIEDAQFVVGNAGEVLLQQSEPGTLLWCLMQYAVTSDSFSSCVHMITSPLRQDSDCFLNRIHLFETEIGESKALTIINRVLAGTGVMILTTVPFAYWIQIASMPVDEFALCGVYSGPSLEEKALILLCYNIFGAFVGMLFYVTENIAGKFTHQKKKQEKKPMKVTLWRESNPLSKVKVATPCSSEWKFMYGNDRVRFCNQC